MSGESEETLSDPRVFLVACEVRHARMGLEDLKKMSILEGEVFEEYIGKSEFINVRYSSSVGKYPKVPIQIDCPLISGLRPLQLSTGSHYKIRSFLGNLRMQVQYFLSFGDGSGGITSCILRHYPHSTGVFNSLLDSAGCSFHGILPRGPNAVAQFGDNLKSRCINFNTCSEEPSDVSFQDYWDFVRSNYVSEKKFDLVVGDCEVRSLEMEMNIINCVRDNIRSILDDQGTLILKTYGTRIHQNKILENLRSMFKQVRLYVSEFTSSHSSELYLVCRGSKARVNKIPDNETMGNIFRIIKANKTDIEELSRAISIDVESAKSGIPRSFIPTADMMLTSILKSIGLSPGLAASVSHYTIHFKNPPMSFLCLVSNFIINTTGWRRSKPYLPSNRRLINHLSIYLGVLYTLARGQRNMKHYQRAKKMNNSPTEYHYHTEGTLGRPMREGTDDIYLRKYKPPDNWCPGKEDKTCSQCKGIAFSVQNNICYQCETGLRSSLSDYHDRCKKCKKKDRSKIMMWKLAWSFQGEGTKFKRVEKPNNALIGSVVRAFSSLTLERQIT